MSKITKTPVLNVLTDNTFACRKQTMSINTFNGVESYAIFRHDK